MTEVAIFGAGGLGRLVRDTLLRAGRFRPAVLLDSNPEKHGQVVDGLQVRGGMEQIPALRRESISAAIVAIGDNPTRMQIAEALRSQGMQLISAIHPLASIAPSAYLGQHLIVGARTIICVHARIGDHCVLSAGSIVEHDNELGAGVFLHPAVRLAGGVKIDDFATLGIGACVIPGRHVGRHAQVEPGGVVIRDVLAGTIVGGAPATRPASETTRFVPERPQDVPRRGTAKKPDQPAAPLHSLAQHKLD